MNTFFNSTVVENIGWTLFHSLWQITLSAFVLFVLLKILRGFSANVRYFAAVFALVLAVAFPVLTFYQLNGNSVSSLTAKEISKTNKIELSEKPVFVPENSSVSNRDETEVSAVKSSGILSSFEDIQKFIATNISTALPFFVGFWLFGMLIFGFRLIGGVWQLHIFKTQKISSPSNEWRGKLDDLCEKLKIRRNVKFFKSGLIETPVVIGWLKPVILVPASIFLNISQKELETIIAHELIHIRRYDALVNFAQSFVEVLFFYHPCFWWISGVIRKEREFAADEAVVKILENSCIVYANALANLEEIRLLTNQKLTPLATAANGGNLMQRISKILQKNTGISRTDSLWTAVSALVLISAVLLGIFSFNTTAIVNVSAKDKDKKLAVGFVSIPTNRASSADKSFDETPRLLIEKLNKHKVPAIGFVLGAQISDGENISNEKADIVRMWRDAGLEVGIGNYKHIWFYDTPFDEYAAGVEKNAEITEKILDEKDIPLRYFSYPYLNTGKTVEDKIRFEDWLKSQNLTSVKYTVDNSEWMYSFAYDNAREAGDTAKTIEIQIEFLKYMSEMFDHYEQYSQEMFGRNINQTMVLTPSRLVADTADKLFAMLEKRGYEFVSMDAAQADVAYQTPENFAGIKAGISWFERWQMAQKKDLLVEPKVAPMIEDAWKARKTNKNLPPKPTVAPTPPDAPPLPPKPSAPPAPPKELNSSIPAEAPLPPAPPAVPIPPIPVKSDF